MIPFGILAAGWTLVDRSVAGDLDVYQRYGIPLLILLLAGVASRSRIPPRVLERIGFCGIAGYLLGKIALSALDAGAAELVAGLVEASYWFFPFYTLALLVFGIGRGVVIACAAHLTVFGIGVAHLVLTGSVHAWHEYGVFLRFFLAGGVFLVMSFALGRLVEVQASHARRMTRQAYTDALTSISNRRGMDDLLTQEIAVAKAYGRALSVVLLDLDHFKRINDAYGHQAGDAVLMEAAALLEQHCRSGDVAGRWGGEEFLLILPGTTRGEAAAVASRVRRAIEEHRFGGGFRITASSGVAERHEGDTKEALFARADQALYRAKAAGRNLVATA